MGKTTQSRVRAIVTHPNIAKTIMWDTIDDGGWTHNNAKVRPASGEHKEVVEGESERSNIKTTTMVDPVTHADFLKLCHNGFKFPNATVARQFVDGAGVPIGDAYAVSGCWAESVSAPQGDANSSELVKVEIEWATP